MTKDNFAWNRRREETSAKNTTNQKDRSGPVPLRKFYSPRKTDDRWNESGGTLYIPEELLKFKMIVDQTHDAVLILDEGRIADVNRSALTMFGFSTKQEMAGLTPADLSPSVQPDGQSSGEKAEKWIRAASLSGENQHFPWQHIHRNGTPMDAEVSLNYLKWQDKVLLVAFIRDRTGIVRIEREIRNRQGYYQIVMNSLPVVLYIAQPSFPFDRSWVGDKIESLSGFDEQTFCNKGVWYSRIHPADRDRVKGILQENPHTSSRMVEYRWMKADGTYAWFRDWLVFKKDENNQPREILGALLDITVRKNAEEKLKQSEAFLDSVVKNIPAMVFVKKADDFSFVRINRSGTELLGLSPEEILGRTDKELFPEQQSRKLNETDRQAVEEKHIVDIPEEHILTAKGERILHTRKIPLFDDNGKPEYLLGISVDITEQQKITRELRNSAEKYLTLIENIPVGIMISTLRGKIIEVNNTTTRILGYPEEELKTQKITGIYAVPDSYERMINQLQKEHRVANYQTIFRKKDHSTVEVSLNVIAYPEYGEDALLTVLTDITRQRKSEEKIRQLSLSVEQSPAAVMILGLHKKIEYTNPKFTGITGYSQNEAREKDLHLLDPGDFSAHSHKEMWGHLMNEENWKGVFYFQRKDGRFFWSEMSVSLLMDNLGKVTHYVAIMEDITSRIQAHEELVSAKEKAEESDRLKSAFLSNISHEIRTPMNAIVGFSQLLKDPELDSAKRHSFIDMIASKSDELLRILEDIIDVSMMQSGKISIEKEDFRLNDLFEELRASFIRKIRPGIQLVMDTGDQKPLIIHSDRKRVQQIMEHLLGNGIKYTDKGKVTFGYQLTKGGRSVTLFVRDSGIGIDPDRIHVIFQPFMQEKITDEQARGGKGIGLTLTRTLAERLGGKISVESEKGKGAIFHVTLPLCQESTEEQSKPGILETPESDEKWKGLTIVIAEDDFMNYRYLEQVLKKTGAEIIHAGNGKKLLELITSGCRPDIILMDIRMPEINGLIATGILRSMDLTVPVIALTAFSSPEDREKCFAAGCNDFLSKPVDAKKLIGMMERYLNKK